MVKIDDIIFWVIILLIIATALWLLNGSPLETNALVSIALFVTASELLLWKALFLTDKKTAIGFEKVRAEIQILKKDLNHQLNEIKNLIKK